MKIENPRVQQLYDYLSKINQTAYQDEFLIVNDVLAKMPSCGDILSTYLKKSPIKKTTLGLILRKLFFFYLKNFLWWAIHLTKKLLHLVSGQKYSLADGLDQLVVVDTYFLMENMLKEKFFKDYYFPNLADTLIRKGKPFVYFPKFYPGISLRCFFKSMKIIKESKVPILTEYQLLRLSDYFSLVLFVVFYPFKLFKLARKLGDEYEDNLLRFTLWETSDTTVVKGYLRLLCGRRLAGFPVKQIKCISWFENQSIDKCFYRGLRKGVNKPIIIGAQLALRPDTLLNFHVDEGEKKFNIIPDKILVNGDYYLSCLNSIENVVGPSMRYKKIFKTKSNPRYAKNILVVMPYYEQDIIYLLDLLDGLSLDAPVFIKFHPATDEEKYINSLPENIEVKNSDLYHLFEDSKIVIGLSTGALVEAASLGIPVICVDNKFGLTYNYLPNFGKGILWERAQKAFEVVDLIDKFGSSVKQDAQQMKSAGEELRRMCFCEPTEKMVLDAFELNG